jgi:deazaflavin-dependent oxidoreductase (nitroreductase family)
MRRLGARRWFSRFSAVVIAPVDRFVYQRSGGRLSTMHVGQRGRAALPTLLLTTTGRKTGQARTAAVAYLEDGERLVLVASNFGQERHPAWSANLLAEPRATVQIRTERRDVVARLAREDEQAALWPRLLEIYPGWTQYREWTDRPFRMFVLEPSR